MSDSIMDNQSINADILNAVSVDLGGDDLIFNANEKFGADKLNGITGDLINSGVSLTGNRCEVHLNNNIISVDTGLIFFADGKKKHITSNVILDFDNTRTNSIYAFNNTVANTIEIKNTEYFPSDSDIVCLAQISSNGTVTDCRQMALMKNASLFPNQYQVIESRLISSATSSPARNNEYSVPAGYQKFLIILNDGSGVFFLDFANSTILKFALGYDDIEMETLNITSEFYASAGPGSGRGIYSVGRTSDKLRLTARQNDDVGSITIDITIYCM